MFGDTLCISRNLKRRLALSQPQMRRPSSRHFEGQQWEIKGPKRRPNFPVFDGSYRSDPQFPYAAELPPGNAPGHRGVRLHCIWVSSYNFHLREICMAPHSHTQRSLFIPKHPPSSSSQTETRPSFYSPLSFFSLSLSFCCSLSHSFSFGASGRAFLVGLSFC